MQPRGAMNIREEITAKILEALKAGAPPWRKGWTSNGLAINASTKKPYRGVNQVLLGLQCVEKGFEDPRWLTYRQAKELGYAVRRGERSTKIVRLVEIELPASGAATEGDVIAEEGSRRLILRSYAVFNARQIDGIPALPEKTHSMEPNDAIEAIVEGMKKTGLKLIHGSANAYYSPHVDTIRLPHQRDFHSAADFFCTLYHELAHATSAPHRLNREVGRPNTDARAREELRAEIAAAFGCAEAGVSLGPHHLQSHQSYIIAWASLLQNDAGEILSAAADAQGICDYLQENALKIEPKMSNVPVVSYDPAALAPRPAPGM